MLLADNMSDTVKVYAIRHKTSDTYCTISGWYYETAFKSRTEIAPHVWNSIGPCKASITNFIKHGAYLGDEKEYRFRVSKEAKLEFILDLEIVEIDLVPGKTVHSYIFEINKITK